MIKRCLVFLQLKKKITSLITMGAEITRRDLKGPCNVLIAFHYLSMYTEQNVLLKKKKKKWHGISQPQENIHSSVAVRKQCCDLAFIKHDQ